MIITANKIICLLLFILLCRKVQVMSLVKPVVDDKTENQHQLSKRVKGIFGGMDIVAQCFKQCGETILHQISVKPVKDDEDGCINVCNITYMPKKDSPQYRSQQQPKRKEGWFH